VCWKCQWRGAAREGSREDYEELFDISCPRCDTTLLIVSTVVTKEEVEEAAAAGHPAAQATLAEIRKWEAEASAEQGEGLE
jgi:hypothetical protein